MIQQCWGHVIYLFFSFNWPVFFHQEGLCASLKKKKKKSVILSREAKPDRSSPPASLSSSPFLSSCLPLPAFLHLFFSLGLFHFCWRFLKATLSHTNPLKITWKCWSVRACKIVQAECFAISLPPPNLVSSLDSLKHMHRFINTFVIADDDNIGLDINIRVVVMFVPHIMLNMWNRCTWPYQLTSNKSCLSTNILWSIDNYKQGMHAILWTPQTNNPMTVWGFKWS